EVSILAHSVSEFHRKADELRQRRDCGLTPRRGTAQETLGADGGNARGNACGLLEAAVKKGAGSIRAVPVARGSRLGVPQGDDREGPVVAALDEGGKTIEQLLVALIGQCSARLGER